MDARTMSKDVICAYEVGDLVARRHMRILTRSSSTVISGYDWNDENNYYLKYGIVLGLPEMDQMTMFPQIPILFFGDQEISYICASDRLEIISKSSEPS